MWKMFVRESQCASNSISGLTGNIVPAPVSVLIGTDGQHCASTSFKLKEGLTSNSGRKQPR
eukprot:366038-Chlamydomonas_euryale.AAC.10